MGVMRCSKNGCEHIMCDTYVEGIGYVCTECQALFIEYTTENEIYPENEGEIALELDKFMKIEKSRFTTDKTHITVAEFFNKKTRR